MKIERVAETPCPPHLRRGRRGSWWTVAVTVPPALPAAAVTRRAETAMRAVAARFPGSRFVGSRLLPALDQPA